MRKCLVCSHDMGTLGEVSDHKILRCPNCGLGETENTDSQKGDYHRDEQYYQEEKLFKNVFLRRVNIINRFKKPGEVLEVGCSTGLMLSLLKKRGWGVSGIEISSKAADIAKSRGIGVITLPFEKINLKKKFDVIILNHTLEHLEDPITVIKKCRQLLKKEGVLYLDVPNFNSLSANILKVNWPLLLVSEHKWHFTYQSLSKLLKDLKFKVLFIDRSSGIWDYDNPFFGVFLSLINFKKRFFTEVMTALPSWIISQLQLGSDLMIIAKKI